MLENAHLSIWPLWDSTNAQLCCLDVPQLHTSSIAFSYAVVRHRSCWVCCTLFLAELHAEHGPSGLPAPAATAKKGMVLPNACQSAGSPYCIDCYRCICVWDVCWRQLCLPASLGHSVPGCIHGHGAGNSCDTQARVKGHDGVQKHNALLGFVTATIRFLTKSSCLCGLAA